MTRYDCVVVGSGINSLVCAAILARQGKSVIVLERNGAPGGCIKTDTTIQPGFIHDLLSLVYPLFITSPAYASLQDDFAAYGVRFANNSTPTGVLTNDGRSLILTTDRQQNIQAFEAAGQGDGLAYQDSMAFIEKNQSLIFGLLGNDFLSRSTAMLLMKEVWRRGLGDSLAFFGESLEPASAWLRRSFSSELVRALFAPWILHGFSGPDCTLSGLINRLIPFTLEHVGNPVVVGGSYKIVEAFCRIIEENGGKVLVDTHVDEIVVENNVATGVRLSNGDTYSAAQGIACNVTPAQLYGDLLKTATISSSIHEQVGKFRYGRGDMQIHLSLNAVPEWPDPALKDVVMLHVTSGLDGVSRATNEADCGLLPDAGTIVVAQPVTLDPGRAPEGHWILWIQLQEVPRFIKGDARGELDIPLNGEWNDTIREAYADRIVDRLSQLIPNLRSSILSRHVISPADLYALNMNLVDGDPYSGECTLDQYLLWRPFSGVKNHTTPVKKLYHIGASTHPGPGLGGISGYLAANAILK